MAPIRETKDQPSPRPRTLANACREGFAICGGAVVSLHNPYSLPVKLDTLFTWAAILSLAFCARESLYCGLPILVDVVLDNSCLRVLRRGAGGHIDTGVPEHEIAESSTLIGVTANKIRSVIAARFPMFEREISLL